MHGRIFVHRRRLRDASLRQYAADLDLDQFDRDVRNDAPADRVRADFDGGIRSGA
jgi:hypothetical protein